jgi:selenocysteine lyase/cysteine desulfurase
LILETGLPEIQERVSKVMRVLIQGLPALGFSPLLFDSSPHAGILAARPPEGKDARYFSSRLDEKRIATSAREGFLRLSPHFGNDEDEAERLLFELKGTL